MHGHGVPTIIATWYYLNQVYFRHIAIDYTNIILVQSSTADSLIFVSLLFQKIYS